MDIENLLKELRRAERYCLNDYSRMAGEASTALSTLQAENEKLRAELEYEREHANAYYEECGQWEAENEKLREKIEDARLEGYAKGLGEMSEENERLWAELEQDFRAFTKQWWEQDSGFPCRWCKFENSGGCEWKAKQPNEEKICAGRAFEWRGPQKED